jgi:hypothetical protein
MAVDIFNTDFFAVGTNQVENLGQLAYFIHPHSYTQGL